LASAPPRSMPADPSWSCCSGPATGRFPRLTKLRLWKLRRKDFPAASPAASVTDFDIEFGSSGRSGAGASQLPLLASAIALSRQAGKDPTAPGHAGGKNELAWFERQIARIE